MNFKLKHSGTVDLTLIHRGDDSFYLADEDGNIVLNLQYNGKYFSPLNVRADIEQDDTFREKLTMLARNLLEQDYMDVEDDPFAEEEGMQDPFDPEEISIDTKTIAMETLLRRLEQGAIILNPDFQRKEVWSDERKSQLIESLLLKIPIPMFYVSSDEKSNWTVVDGLQRLSTVRDFILGQEYLKDTKKNADKKGNGLKLKGLEFWNEYEGCNLNALPIHLYNRILETEFRFTIINPGTPEEVKRNIFKRLNTGGMPLSSQEIRNALYTGVATILLNDLAEMKEFVKATGGSIKAQRMEDKELILRFVSFLLRKPAMYNKNYNIDTWLSDTMIIINALPNLETREVKKNIKKGTIIKENITLMNTQNIKEIFAVAMVRAKQLFGEHAFRKSYPGQRRSPINKSLFETWGILLSDLHPEEFRLLLEKKKSFMDEYKLILSDSKFVIAISRDSMKHLSVKYRFNTLLNLVNKYIK